MKNKKLIVAIIGIIVAVLIIILLIISMLNTKEKTYEEYTESSETVPTEMDIGSDSVDTTEVTLKDGKLSDGNYTYNNPLLYSARYKSYLGEYDYDSIEIISSYSESVIHKIEKDRNIKLDHIIRIVDDNVGDYPSTNIYVIFDNMEMWLIRDFYTYNEASAYVVDDHSKEDLIFRLDEEASFINERYD